MSPPGSASTCRPVTPIHQAYNACRMFRKFRILLLLVLATVALSAWRANARLTSWEHSVHIALYPVVYGYASFFWYVKMYNRFLFF